MYAFMRYCDDISDAEEESTPLPAEPALVPDQERVSPLEMKARALEQWRTALDEAMAGNYGDNEIMPAFHDAMSRFKIPAKYFHELIDGAEMDLSIGRYETFDELYEYCYRVASVVGLVCIHIFGFSEDIAMQYAEYYGIAFQLTNILRDIKEDAERGRIYLPLEDLRQFGYSEADLVNSVSDDRFYRLMQFEVERARSYYLKGAPLVDLIDKASRGGLMAMVGIYSGVLNRIEERNYDVFTERMTLSTKEKLSIAARALIDAQRSRENSLSPGGRG
jgi:phytoene synthase